ncbi:PREDICTED: uncharacterized protein LOC105453747 [Wasmannia auropunctata]|uniref:uncharacterized protein LOC105453747 n=1 Tax=Wasmannia auropunctata TaxID=64793 RepID=UPI0005EEBAAA|nr:PREDICTED: uncharacterized protein LOC105453747 [Wasmannia auropunctata]
MTAATMQQAETSSIHRPRERRHRFESLLRPPLRSVASDLRVCTPTAASLERKSVVRISRFLLGSFRRSHGDFALRNFDGCHAYHGYDNLSKIHPSLPKSCTASLFYRIFSGSVHCVLEVRGAYRNQITSCSQDE